MFDPTDVTSHGFQYIGIGKPPLVFALADLVSAAASQSHEKALC